jgi:Ser/Thr protein kinase RdoA (MazF antagonist)
VLSYISGEAICPPYPRWALTDAALTSVADLLRAYHQAIATFDAGGRDWQRCVPTPFRTGLVSHNDPNLDNVVFRDRQAVALIDFDLSSPGSVVWDVAAAARLWAPLRPDGDIADARRGRALARFRTFVDAYGLVGADRERVAEAVIQNHDWCYDVVRHGAATGHHGFTQYWSDAAARAHRTRSWYERNLDLLRAALQRE